MMKKNPSKKKYPIMHSLRAQAKAIVAKKMLDKPMSYKPGAKKLVKQDTFGG